MSNPSYLKMISAIRAFFACYDATEMFSAEDIATAINEPKISTFPALVDLCRRNILGFKEINDTTYYFRSASYVSRHIIPLFAGSPEWVVETFAGDHICWCSNQFNAALITDSLNRG
jgi:hypothetical protein